MAHELKDRQPLIVTVDFRTGMATFVYATGDDPLVERIQGETPVYHRGRSNSRQTQEIWDQHQITFASGREPVSEFNRRLAEQ